MFLFHKSPPTTVLKAVIFRLRLSVLGVLPWVHDECFTPALHSWFKSSKLDDELLIWISCVVLGQNPKCSLRRAPGLSLGNPALRHCSYSQQTLLKMLEAIYTNPNMTIKVWQRWDGREDCGYLHQCGDTGGTVRSAPLYICRKTIYMTFTTPLLRNRPAKTTWLQRDQLQTSCNKLTEERDQLQTSCKNLTEERNQLQASYNNLTKERDQLQTSCKNLTEERDQLQASYNNLTKERDQLQTSCKNLSEERLSVHKGLWLFGFWNAPKSS
jgi:cell division protein FtsB